MPFKFNKTDVTMVYSDQLAALINDCEEVKIVLGYGFSKLGSVEKSPEINMIIYVDHIDKYLKEETWTNIFNDILSIIIRKSKIRNAVEILLSNGQLLNLKFESVKDLYLLKRCFHIKKDFLSYFISSRRKNYAARKIDFLKQDIKAGYCVLKDKIAATDFFEPMMIRIISSDRGRVTTAMVLENYHCFWQNSYRLIVKLYRKDFFYAVVILDYAVKKNLLEMIQWSHIDMEQISELVPDTHSIKDWCSVEMQNNLMHTLPHSNIKEMNKAILNSLALYIEVSGCVSKSCNLKLDLSLQTKVHDLAMLLLKLD